MITVRQIERMWNSHSHEPMTRQLLTMRPESCPRILLHLRGAVPAAALGLIRLDEMDQPLVPISRPLLRTLLAAQEPDGGWIDPIVTALVTRALLCGEGSGIAVDRAVRYLADLQKDEGLWPLVGFRRMPADPLASAYIVAQLGSEPTFAASVRPHDTIRWFDSHRPDLDADTLRLWSLALLRCRLAMRGGIGATGQLVSTQ